MNQNAELSMNNPLSRLCIVGTGLIGGSLALAAKQRGLVEHVCAWGRNSQRLQKAKELGVIDSFSTNLQEAIQDASMIVVGTPVLIAEKNLVDILGTYLSKAIVTDVGSTKGNLYRAVKNALGSVPSNLVLGHPIAGAETSGVESAKADLYERHRVILTPSEETSQDALQVVESLWSNVGAQVIHMPIDQHDKVLAATSHLPHFLAYAIMDTLITMEEKEHEVFRFAAGGFRDFTRIAKSNPQMWHDIAMANKPALLKSIDDFSSHLAQIRNAIEQENSDSLLTLLEHVSETRKALHDNVLPKKS